MRESMLVATRLPKTGTGEAEPVTVTVDEFVIELVLDDGERLIFDARELREATTPILGVTSGAPSRTLNKVPRRRVSAPGPANRR